MLLLPFKK